MYNFYRYLDSGHGTLTWTRASFILHTTFIWSLETAAQITVECLNFHSSHTAHQLAVRSYNRCIATQKLKHTKCNANVPQLKTGYIFRELGCYATVDIYW